MGKLIALDCQSLADWLVDKSVRTRSLRWLSVDILSLSSSISLEHCLLHTESVQGWR